MKSKQKPYPRIKDLRKDKDMTQAEIALNLGLHTTQYQRYERGEITVPAYIIVDLAKYYNVSTDYILGLTDNPEPYKKRNNG